MSQFQGRSKLSPSDVPNSAPHHNGDLNTPGPGRGPELTPETRRAIDALCAHRFLWHAEGLMRSLYYALVPPGMASFDPDALTSVQTDSELGLRDELVEERRRVFDLVKEGHALYLELGKAVGGDADAVSSIVERRLYPLLDALHDEIGVLTLLNTRLNEARLALLREGFPSQASLEAQLGRSFRSLDEYVQFREEALGNTKDNVTYPGELRRGHIETLRHSLSDIRQPLDLNFEFLSMVNHLPAEFGSGLVEDCPQAQVRPADFRFLLGAAHYGLSEARRIATWSAINASAEQNTLFNAIRTPEFLDTAPGNLLAWYHFDMKPAEISLAPDGTVSLHVGMPDTVCEAVIAQLAQTASSPGDPLLQAMQEVADRNQVKVSWDFEAEGGVQVQFTPFCTNDRVRGSFERWRDYTPSAREGFNQDEEQEEYAEEAEREDPRATITVCLPRSLEQEEAPARTYRLFVDGAAILNEEAGSRLADLAETIDDFVSVLPHCDAVVMRKFQLEAPQGSNLIFSPRDAMSHTEAYAQGEFDLISFQRSSSMLSSRWYSELVDELNDCFPWQKPFERLPREDLVNGIDESIAALNGIGFDYDTFNDPRILTCLRRLTAHVDLLEFPGVSAVLKGWSWAVGRELTFPQILQELTVAAKFVSLEHPGQRLCCRVRDTAVTRVTMNSDPVQHVAMAEFVDSENRLVGKAYFDAEYGHFIYRPLLEADVQDAEARLTRALHSARQAAHSADLHSIAAALEAQGIRNTDKFLSLVLLVHVDHPEQDHNLPMALRKGLCSPYVYLERGEGDLLTIRSANGVSH